MLQSQCYIRLTEENKPHRACYTVKLPVGGWMNKMSKNFFRANFLIAAVALAFYAVEVAIFY